MTVAVRDFASHLQAHSFGFCLQSSLPKRSPNNLTSPACCRLSIYIISSPPLKLPSHVANQLHSEFSTEQQPATIQDAWNDMEQYEEALLPVVILMASLMMLSRSQLQALSLLACHQPGCQAGL